MTTLPDDPVGDASAVNELLWERHAAWWQRNFGGGTDAEYRDLILPLVARHLVGARRVLDVGCGEGQVARRIADLGAHVVGIDPTFTQVRAARVQGGPEYARARAEQLPFRSGAFDAVALCLAIEHVDDYEAAIREIARVLEPGGRFVFLLCHPLLQAPRSGWVDDEIEGAHYWRIGAYLGDYSEVDEVAPGVSLRFVHRPLGRYVHAMGESGLLIDDMEEPSPPAAMLREVWQFPEASTIPRLLLIRARRA